MQKVTIIGLIGALALLLIASIAITTQRQGKFTTNDQTSSMPLPPMNDDLIPQFGVNNPNPFFKEARQAGADISKKLPQLWLQLEPFRPQPERKAITEYTIADLGIMDFPPDVRANMEAKFNKSLQNIDVQNSSIEYKQDNQGRWHIFTWHGSDDYVRQAQRVNMRVMFNMVFNSLWASEPEALVKSLAEGGYNAPLRDPSYAADIQFFTQALVERYDGDGINDMPGLQQQILLWEDGNEYNVPRYWTGTNEQYFTMWQAFSRGVRAAHPAAQVLGNGIASIEEIRHDLNNAGKFSAAKAINNVISSKPDAAKQLAQLSGEQQQQIEVILSNENATADQLISDLQKLSLPQKISDGFESIVAWRGRSADFLFMQLDNPQLFDIFVHHVYMYYAHNPNRIEADMDFIKVEMTKRGYRKPVIVLEASGASLLDDTVPNGVAILRKIQSGDQMVRQKYDAELAKEMVKIHTTLFAHGVSSVVRFPFRDFWNLDEWPEQHSQYAIQGMVLLKKDLDLAYLKPSYFTYQKMTSLLNGFAKAQELEPGLIRFTFEDRQPVYVAWTNSSSAEIDLSTYIKQPTVTIQHIITELTNQNNPKYLENRQTPTTKIPISDEPVFITLDKQ